MTNPKGKRNRAVVAVLLPAIIFIWVVGWSLYWIGHQRESRKPNPPSSRRDDDYIRLEAMPLEEFLEAKSCKN
jgi:hypothetical protein